MSRDCCFVVDEWLDSFSCEGFGEAVRVSFGGNQMRVM
jgi:hypothetical protein